MFHDKCKGGADTCLLWTSRVLELLEERTSSCFYREHFPIRCHKNITSSPDKTCFLLLDQKDVAELENNVFKAWQYNIFQIWDFFLLIKL